MDGGLIPQQKKERLKMMPFSHLSQIADLSSKCLAAGTFPIFLEEDHKSAHRLQQVDCFGWLRFRTEILKGIGCDEIIVLIVLIGTEFLNEAKSFSLINAAQILYHQIKQTKHLW